MSILQCTFLSALLYLQCGARNENPPLDKIRGSWLIRNVSQNAISLLGDCPSVDIEPSSEKSRHKTGKVLLINKETTYTLTITEKDHTTYQILNTESVPLGNLSFLKVEIDTFLVAQVIRADETYYAVLTDENKTSEKVDKKISKFWNSSDSTKNIPLIPIKQDDCPTSKSNSTWDKVEGNNSTPITSITTAETLIIDAILVPISHLDEPLKNTSSRDKTARTLPPTDFRPNIIIKLSGNTDSITSTQPSRVTVSQSIPPKDNEGNLVIERSVSARIAPESILIFAILMLFFEI